MISSPIIPAIIPKSVADIEAFLLRLPKVPDLHVDVVDGVFVPAVSWAPGWRCRTRAGQYPAPVRPRGCADRGL